MTGTDLLSNLGAGTDGNCRKRRHTRAYATLCERAKSAGMSREGPTRL
jgi:hypothetical protein